MTNNTKLLLQLSICALISCFVILTVYAVRAPNPMIARLPFAILLSGLPMLVAWPVCAWLKLSRTWIVIVYAILFLLTILLQAGLR